jgi:hypothetical protein
MARTSSVALSSRSPREINEPARRMIGKARARGEGRRIDFWDGDRLAETIQTSWMHDFEKYFRDQLDKNDALDDDAVQVVDVAFIAQNYERVLVASRKVRKTLSKSTWSVLRGLIEVSAFGPDGESTSFGGPRRVEVSEFLLELGRTEESIQQELEELARYDYIDWDDEGNLRVAGNAEVLWKLARIVVKELADAAEDEETAGEIFNHLVP